MSLAFASLTFLPSSTQSPMDLTSLLKDEESPCTVQSLPPEVLLQIFLKNTELGDSSHHRLNTARYTSQVCRLWRVNLLGNGSVWGRLLELDYYRRSGDEWKNEVLSRSRDALLWITGSLSRLTAPWLYSVLDKKWQNVQILDIQVLTTNVTWRLYYQGKLWPLLCRDAPSLETIYLRRVMGQVPSEPCSAALFNGVAPRLRDFEIPLIFHPIENRLWLSTLHGLTLFAHHTIPTIISVLRSTPLLRRLKLHGNMKENSSRVEYTDPSIAQLRHLEWLELIGCPAYLMLVLELIPLPTRRPTLRKLSVATCHHLSCSDPPPQVIERMQWSFMKWIQAYVEDFPPKCISLEERMVHGPDSSLDIISIESHWNGTEGLTLTMSLALIPALVASSLFSTVQELRMQPGSSPTLLAPLYKAFHSVTELSVDGIRIKELFDLVDQFSLFPHLRILRWNQLMVTYFPRMLDFLERRAAAGSPLSVLYLPPKEVHRLSDLHKSRLDRIPGLVSDFIVKLTTLPRNLWEESFDDISCAITCRSDSPPFSAIEELRVFLPRDPFDLLALLPLYKALRSIKHLVVTGLGTGALFNHMHDFSLFLHLDVLELYSHGADTIDDRSGEEYIIPIAIRLLEHRVSTGYPISLLDLSSFDVAGVSDVSKERLEKIAGLSVKYPEGE
ncbi:hypothetical protein D9613_011876 [Agrocybe pediades]|uniref:F-box domain-containing protein n=1 Tax=Agrocybe pediades TaxID=84607 RepID=A0A8H4QKS1_9AGAR|nr:hypothetical protein D9613_011876 [Agrocybe pediades]